MGAAVDWLGNNAEKSIEELKEDEDEEAAGLVLQPGEQARSLICKDCGKKFRSTAQAEFHANRRYESYYFPHLPNMMADILFSVLSQ